ncbi:uncharacterized protein LOC143459655 isoform X2 [Clavelina lepadiformis]|uniref:uncharacterized protein LOC143459655 isoform X2 n=1 Tax=Clavelina lepadiformis TaxID=159417 RepID=UPI00404225B3
MLFKQKRPEGVDRKRRETQTQTDNNDDLIEVNQSLSISGKNTSTTGLRVNGANVSAATVQAASLDQPVKARNPVGLDQGQHQAGEDKDGFLVRRLTSSHKDARKQRSFTSVGFSHPAGNQAGAHPPSTFYTTFIRPPPTAPRSSPVLGGLYEGQVQHQTPGQDICNRQFYNPYSDMALMAREGRDLSLPRIPTSRQMAQDTTQRLQTAHSSQQRFPGITRDLQHQGASPRPDTSMSNSVLPPYLVRSTLDDVERLPAIHPSVWASRGERRVDYRGFVSAPPTSASVPGTAVGRARPSQKNAIPLKRPSAVKKVEATNTECWRCALKLEHSKCESTKYIRIGGGFRHSYWFVRKLIDQAREEEEKQLALIRREHKKIFTEKLAWRVGKDGQRERRIKTFVRTSSGRRIAKYQYVPEDVYNEMMELNKAGSRATESAKRRLKQKLAMSMGLSEDDAEMLDTWDAQSVGADDVAMDEEGNPLLDEDGEPIRTEDTEKVYRAREKQRRKKEGRIHDSDEESERADSGLAFSDTEARERRRRYRGGKDSDGRRGRRHRRRSYSDSDSDSDSGADAESRRGRKKRHRRRRRSRSYSSDESDRSSRSRDRHRRRRHRRHRRSSRDSDDSRYSSEDSSRSGSRHRGRRKRRGRHRRHSSDRSGSESGSSSGSRSRHRRHRRRRKHRHSDSDSGSDRSRSRRHRRRRRRHRDSSSSTYYSTSSDDSRPRRRHRRHRRHSDDDDSDSSRSRDRGKGRKRDKRRDRRRRRYSTSTEESSAGDEKSSRRRDKDRRRRRRDRYYSSDSDSDSSYGNRRRRDKKKQRPPRPPSSDSSSLSSDASSDRLGRMTKKERRAYEKRRQDKTERKERRQQQREEFERYVEKKERKKERRRLREGRASVSSSSDDDSWGDGKTAVKYGRGSRRKILDKHKKTDDRDIGYDDPNDPWARKEKRREKKKKDRMRKGGAGPSGSEPSSSSDSEFDPSDPFREKKKKEKRKKKGKAGDISSDSDDDQSIYEDVFEEDGTVQRRKVKASKKKGAKNKKVYDDDELDAASEYDSIGSADADKLIARQIYDKDGEVIRLTKDGRRIKDGKISKEVFDIEKHQQKKKKKKKDKQMMEKSYEEEYVEEFIDEEGNVVKVVKKRLKEKTTAPGKRPATPLVGPRRVQVLFLKGGKLMQSRLEKLLAECSLNDQDPRMILSKNDDFGATDLDEREGAIDYLTHYRLVNPANLEVYGKAFLVEDNDENYIVNLGETRVALEGIPALQNLNDKQVNYILKVLGIDDTTMVTFKMFAVIASLCERLLSVLDDQTKQWMEINDLSDMERKIGLYRSMFYWNTSSDRSANYIKATSLRIELIAGGLNRVQEEYVIQKIEPNMYKEVSFIDYMAFIPLFLTTHDSIIENPLDMSRDKFNNTKALEPQRDLVPLGRPMTQVGASSMQSIPIPYEFEKRPGSSLRKRIRLVTPKPKLPTPDPNDNDSLAGSFDSFSPVPPKVSRVTALRRETIMAGTR